jgi:hypothetical protein
MRRVAVVVISDRGDRYLPRCLASIDRFFPNEFITQRVIVDDPDHEYTASGAVRVGWGAVEDADFVFSVEEDFILTQGVDVEGMAAVLDAEENLASLCLLRQPWSQPEVDAGGIIQLYADQCTDRETLGHAWVQHRLFFSLNPCLVPRRVFSQGFEEGSEPRQTERLLAQGYVFGYWGRREDKPRCLHVGNVRAAGSVR